MLNTKNILVTTTSSIDGLKVKKYLKPVSAHIVAGTNLFNDFFASFSDVFGGRSHTYQRQLTSLYNEAIDRLKASAYEIGGNCIVGLKIDMDEISGKGKSMFMLTAIGTAVILEETDKVTLRESDQTFENVGVDKIKTLQKKRILIKAAGNGELKLDEETWDSLTENQVFEVYNYILVKFQKLIASSSDTPDAINNFYKRIQNYIDSMQEENKVSLLYYSAIHESNEKLLNKVYKLIEDLQLLDLERIKAIFKEETFENQKKIFKILLYDKPFYNKTDLDSLKEILEIIKTKFTEKGTRSMKKQLLSSKEKEVWTCECAKTHDLDSYCSNCKKDIYGFTTTETSPPKAISGLEEKISLIIEYLK